MPVKVFPDCFKSIQAGCWFVAPSGVFTVTDPDHFPATSAAKREPVNSREASSIDGNFRLLIPY